MSSSLTLRTKKIIRKRNRVYYIIQDNLFREEGHTKLINFLDKFGFDFEVVTINKDSDDIVFNTDRKDVFVFGSLKMARISKKYGWYPGTLITENHNYEVYSKYYKDNLLNYDSKVVRIGDNFDWISRKYFIRPVLDSKIFTGRVFEKQAWTYLKERLLLDRYSSATEDTLIQIATPKNITQEVRCWIVGGKVITQSTYRRGTFLFYNDNVDPDAIEYAQSMVDIFQLSDAFTIDIGLTDNGWKIIECGSVACAGFYDCDVQKLVIALDEKFQ